MELLLELHCLNNEGCFYMLLLGLLREDIHHVKSLTYAFFLTCSVAVDFKFRVIIGEGLRIGIENTIIASSLY